MEVTLSVIEYLGRFAADEAVPAAARQQAIASLTHVLRWHPLREARHEAVGAIIAVLGLRAIAGSTGTSGVTQPPAGSPHVVCRVNSLDNRVAAELIDSAAAILVDPDLDDDEGFKAEVLRMLGLLVDVGKLPQSRVGRTVDAVNRVLQDSPFSDLQIAALGVLDSLLSPHQTAIAAPQKPAIQTRLIDVVVSGAALDLKSGALQLLVRYGMDVKLRSRVVNEFPNHQIFAAPGTRKARDGKSVLDVPGDITGLLGQFCGRLNLDKREDAPPSQGPFHNPAPRLDDKPLHPQHDGDSQSVPIPRVQPHCQQLGLLFLGHIQ